MNEFYLLDTCAWLDALSAPDLLKPRISKLINSQRTIHLASISLLEVARKEEALNLKHEILNSKSERRSGNKERKI